MQLLVTGAGGLLGSNIVSTAVQAGHDVLGTYHTDKPDLMAPHRRLDITHHETFRKLVNESAPDVVVNCAAMTDVDSCESKPTHAEKVNGQAPGNIAAICAERNIAFVQVSTDYVFDGKRETKYREDITPNPIQTYGQTKLTGERRVFECHPSALIIRLSFVYGVHEDTSDLEGFPAWVVSRLGTGEEVPLFVDQHITPTRAGQAAETILTLVSDDAAGTYHIACSECVTPYKFGEGICNQLDIDTSLLMESTTADVSRSASRPTHTCLDVDRVEARLGRPQPDLAEDLQAIRSSLEAGVR
ncbi:dTDP-4-dehydrorhamnose reductase [Halobacterium sp. R2-5]|uniref:dTDP-4-dehydrorhamnose reductase n=1 Tax=Halobacterium sp. R2-5 TaxID=2715751 RepID=UPI00141F94AF|nr:dTDP-4-dehydrorhamnose reductase [Halobacterium sp. R2-5]NIB99448.1 dTDP-4-dehydrorhamnose reductase [Halobacterium sp. R2-5]